MTISLMTPWGGGTLTYSDAGVLDGYYRGAAVWIKRKAVRETPPRDERSENDPDHNAMCGEDALSSALWAVGADVPALAIVQHLRAQGGEGSVRSGTVAQQLAAASYELAGVEADTSGGSPSSLWHLIDEGYPVLFCVWCTPYAIPCSAATSMQYRSGGLGHWLTGIPPVTAASDEVNAGHAQGLAVLLDAATLFRTRETPDATGQSPVGYNATALLQSDGADLIKMVHDMLNQDESVKKRSAVQWILDHKAALTQVLQAAPGPAASGDPALAARVNKLEAELQAVKAAIQ